MLEEYLCLFICFGTKAVHFELNSLFSTPTFLNASFRFVSRNLIALIKKGKPIAARLAKLSPFVYTIVPHVCHSTTVSIRHFDEVNLHPAVQALQIILHESFWILGNKQEIWKCVHQCSQMLPCSVSSSHPVMAYLSAIRVQQV
ncbi:hypothetical protein PR048_012547 [Dryococelus australis]|uniref:Uncharacterized protein n=1 Tax=Dryococelus australis TaxID=614101 RepID=A0ABQ9HPQ0_9NEOP|nr:hypothetical protein PR048_012547 [Dryococelus australis]